MITLRGLFYSSISICHHTIRCFGAQSYAVPSYSKYDELINAAGRDRDFAAVCRLLSNRLSYGCLNTKNTFKFIATDISVVEELLRTLADLDDWFARKHAHDSLVAQLARLHHTAEAVRVAETMARKGYGATATTFLPIFNALARRKEMSAAWRVVEVMRACSVRPCLTSYNYILTAYCSVGDVASAADTLMKMEAEGMKADSRTYDALVLGACRAGKVDGALALMSRIVEEGVPALFSSYAHVIKEMVRRGYDAHAVEFVRAFAGRDEKLDTENFGYLARCLKNMKRIAEAKSVVEEILERGLPIGHGLEDLM